MSCSTPQNSELYSVTQNTCTSMYNSNGPAPPMADVVNLANHNLNKWN